MLIFELFSILFYFCSSYEIIPITNFEKKFISLTNTKSFMIISYFHQGKPIVSKYLHKIRRYYISSLNINHYLYIYENISHIQQDEAGRFVNYELIKYLKEKDDIFEFEEYHAFNKTYYFVIQNDYNVKEDLNITLSIYSTDTPAYLSNMVQEFINMNSKYTSLTYILIIPSNHEKYILFELMDFSSFYPTGITIYENEDIMVYKNSSYYIDHYFTLKDNCSYKIQLDIPIINIYHKMLKLELYFHFVQSKYIKFLPVEINTEYLINYHIYKDTSLLLNITTIEKGNKMMIEYYKHWGGDNNFTIYGIESEDENIIEKTSGDELKFIETEEYENTIQTYVHKKSDNIKLIIFKIKCPENKFHEYFFGIKYRKQEKYIETNVYISIAIGISLSIPNVIIHIIASSKKMEIHSYFNPVLDLLLHMAYGNIFSTLVYLGGKS